MTMLDKKTFSAEASSQLCRLCGEAPTNMNNLDLVKSYEVDAVLFKYGLSTFHAWTRFFECVLHISYRFPIKKWQVRGNDKLVVQARKSENQVQLREEMGLLVDKPIASSGNTNNCNTARLFFREPELASRITGVSKELIYKFSVILRVLTSGHEIGSETFC